jgi:ribosomal RNA methyltransferase Nop2
MKKQGPPAPLDESKITILKKRKASEVESKPASDKKRRTENEALKSKPKTKINQVSNAKAKNNVSQPERSEKQKKKPPKKVAQFFESDDELSSDHDAEDLMGDEFEDLDGVSDGSIDSQNEGSGSDSDSVFDSEEDDHPRETLFSEDEDVSDAEEKLTAANIEGLSRKLDMQREAEEEEAQRDLQESAMQTNIAGDRLDVFGEEGARPGLAPDLQFLRTRITDTIRILGDLATLGQPGKSRADYVDLLISDICTYYGYTPFLAEKLFSLFTPMEAFAFFEANETPVSLLPCCLCG